MCATTLHPSTTTISDLRNHIDGRTFGRLHDLQIDSASDGRLRVSATAHSRFVGQLAEWAVLERMAPADVYLSISVCVPSRRFMEVPK